MTQFIRPANQSDTCSVARERHVRTQREAKVDRRPGALIPHRPRPEALIKISMRRCARREKSVFTFLVVEAKGLFQLLLHHFVVLLEEVDRHPAERVEIQLADACGAQN